MMLVEPNFYLDTSAWFTILKGIPTVTFAFNPRGGAVKFLRP